MKYALIDSGNQRKLEQIGEHRIIRPCSQALWTPQLGKEEWAKVDAHFSREEENKWEGKLPSTWIAYWSELQFKIVPTDFGHIGLFPEHASIWEWAAKKINKRPCRVLNLFAYSGGATMALAKAGAEVCHIDSSKGMVHWARENARLNNLETAPIRWIIDDAIRFMKREKRRDSLYDGIILDPPSFGRGATGEVFKIEKDILTLLAHARDLLSRRPLFMAFSTHTPGMTPMVMGHLLEQTVGRKVESGEMILPSKGGFPLTCGSFARVAWE